MTTADRRQQRRDDFARRVGPHMQASEKRIVDVPAQPGIMAHRQFLVDTACGREITTTLTTRRTDLVHCPDCVAATAAMV